MNRFFQCIEPGAKIKVFIVTFDFELKRREIPAFRAAIVEKVGRENVLFHNHMQTGRLPVWISPHTVQDIQALPRGRVHQSRHRRDPQVF